MRKRFYNPYFTPMQYSPALWLDASDRSTLIMDGARTFNGSTQYLEVANTNLKADAPLYASCWVKFTSTVVSQQVFGIAYGGSNSANQYAISTNVPGTFQFQAADTVNVVKAVNGSGAVLNTWYHVALWYTGTEMYLYVDNVKYGPTSIGNGIRSALYPFRVGASSSPAYMTGQVDSLVVCKSPSVSVDSLNSYLYNSGSGRRSSDFMASAYYTGGNPSGAVSWWDMDARSGDEPDRSGIVAVHAIPDNARGNDSGEIPGQQVGDHRSMTSHQFRVLLIVF